MDADRDQVIHGDICARSGSRSMSAKRGMMAVSSWLPWMMPNQSDACFQIGVLSI